MSVHRLNQHSPAAYRDALQPEAESELSALETEMRGADPADTKTAARLVRRVQTLLELKHVFTPAQRTFWAGSFWALAARDGAPAPFAALCLNQYSKILHNRAPLDAPIPWEPVLALLQRVLFPGERTRASCGASVDRALRRALLQAARASRHHFAPDAAGAIVAAVEPFVRNPRRAEVFVGAGLLVVLLPTHGADYGPWLPAWLELWGAVDHCTEWDYHWATLFARALKQGAAADWAALAPRLAAQAQASLRLSVNAGARVENRRWPADARVVLGVNSGAAAAASGKLVAALVARGVPGAADALQGLLRATRTFYHPSNSGSWSDRLGQFLNGVCTTLARRCESPCGAGAAALLQELLEVATLAAYSKNASLTASAHASLKALVCLEPGLFEQQMTRLQEALAPGAANQRHKAPAALRSLAVMAQPLLHPVPKLAPFVPMVLRLAQAAIDTNDSSKTMSALFLYQTVLFWVPLTPSSDASQAPADDADPAYACWAAGDQLVEWTYGFLETMLAFVRDRVVESSSADNATDPEGQSEEEKAKAAAEAGPEALAKLQMSRQARTDEAISFLLQYVLEQLFQTVDESTHRALMQQAFRFLTSESFKAGSKDVLSLVSAMSRAAPEAALELIVGHVYDAAVTAEGELKEDLPGSRLARLLTLVQGACRNTGSAAALLGQRERLQTLLRVTLASEGSAGSARDVLRDLLRSLLDFYLVEHRCLPPAQWAAGDLGRKWAQPTAWADMEPRWHEPSEAERAWAAELIAEFVEPALAELEAPDAEWGASGWAKRIATVEVALTGGAALLADSAEFSEPSHAVGRPGAWVIDGLRQRIVAAAHVAASHFLQHRENDTKGVTSVLGLIKTACTHRGARSVGPRIKLLQAMRSQFSNPVADAALKRELRAEMAAGQRLSHADVGQHARLPRLVCLERVELQHQQRLKQLGFDVPRALKAAGSPLLAGYETLLGDLLLFSEHMYAGVRQAAQGAWTEVSVRFPWAVPAQLRAQCQRLCTPGTSYEQLSAAVTLLGQARPVRVVARDWALLPLFLSSVCRSDAAVRALPAEKQERAAALVAKLLGEMGGAWHALSPAPAGPSVAELRAELAGHGGAPAPWRTQLLVAAALSFTAWGADGDGDGQVMWDYLADCVESDVESVRLVGLHMLSDALFTSAGDAAPAERLTSQPFVEGLCRALAADHRIATRAADGSVDTRQQQTAPAGVAELVCETRRPRWHADRSRLALVSKAFSTRHAQMAEGWFRACGPAAVAAARPHLERLAAVTDAEQRLQQSVMLELVGGLVRAGAGAGAEGWADVALPLLRAAVEASSLETAWDVVDCVRFCVAGRAPADVAPLVEAAVAALRAALSAAEYALPAKWLRVVQALFIAFAAHEGAPLAAADELLVAGVQAAVLEHMGHPYVACREELGRLVYTALAACSPAAGGELVAALVGADFALDDEAGRRRTETLMFALMHSVASGDAADFGPLLAAALPVVLQAQGSEQPEFNALATTCARALAESAHCFSSTDAVVAALVPSAEWSWRARVAALGFIAPFVAHHAAVLPAEAREALEGAVTKQLTNEQVEVQDAAGAALAGLVGDSDDATRARLLDKFMDKSRKAMRKSRVLREAAKKDPAKKPEADKAVRRERGAVLGLSALVLAFPYDVPPGVPGAVAQLCGHYSSVHGVANVAKQTLAEFRRTHEDMWEVHSMAFSEDELRAFNETLVSPHYYT